MQPNTVEHFKAWASDLILDTFDPWVVEPFQEAVLADVFAGTPAVWFIVPEGNGKTTLVAGLVLYHIQHTEEGWVPVAASSRQQAEILYRQAEGFALRSPKLAAAEMFRCQEGYRRIRCDRTRSRIQIFSADDATADGVIPTLDVVEELHRHKNLRLYDTWRGKYGKRKGQTLVPSTAGEPGGEFERRREQIRQRATEVTVDGAFGRYASDQLVLHQWALQEGEDPEDLEAVKRANPFSGVTIESLREKFSAPDFAMQHWRRFTCNLPTRSELSAIEEAEWFAAKVDDGIPDGEPVDVGLDLGWKHDTTAIVPLWAREPEFRLFGPAQILVPPRDGTFMDPARVHVALLELHDRNPIRSVVMDITDAREVADWIDTQIGCEIIPLSQQIPQQVENYKRFTKALRSGWLHHTGDEGLTAHVLNALSRLLPGGDMVFSRPVESRHDANRQDMRVIDALVAAAMVHAVVDSELSAGPAGDLLVL